MEGNFFFLKKLKIKLCWNPKITILLINLPFTQDVPARSTTASVYFQLLHQSYQNCSLTLSVQLNKDQSAQAVELVELKKANLKQLTLNIIILGISSVNCLDVGKYFYTADQADFWEQRKWLYRRALWDSEKPSASGSFTTVQSNTNPAKVLNVFPTNQTTRLKQKQRTSRESDDLFLWEISVLSLQEEPWSILEFTQTPSHESTTTQRIKTILLFIINVPPYFTWHSWFTKTGGMGSVSTQNN